MSNKVYNKYTGVDITIDTYLKFINYWKKTTSSISGDGFYLFGNKIIEARLIISTIQAQIARTNEAILDLEQTEIEKEIQEQLDEYLDNSDIIKRVKVKENVETQLTPKEIRQQIKNSLAHASYDFIEDDNGNILIEIDSPKIKATYTFDELIDISCIYSCGYAKLDSNDVCYDPTELILLKANNKSLLEKAIQNIRYGKCVYNFKFPRFLGFVGQVIEGEKIELNQEQKDLIRNYILYGGLQSFSQLRDIEKIKLFHDRIKPIIENKPHYRSSYDDIMYSFDYLAFHGKGKVKENDFNRMRLEAPSLYTNLLLDLGFLCLNHIKESTREEELPEFNYRNIDLRGVRYWPQNVVEYVDADKKINTEIATVENQKNSKRRELKKINKYLKQLDGCQTLSESQKETLIKNREIANNLKLEINDLINKENDLKSKIGTVQDYYETNGFFRHLRNSISHGFYSIDYSDGLKRKDLGKIIFHFEDWEIDKNDRTNRNKVFEATMTAETLTNLFVQLRERLVKSINSQYADDEKPIDENDIAFIEISKGKILSMINR